MAIALDKDVVFNPISFENFVAPFQIYKQAYDQVDAKYDELSKAAQLEFLMASDQDKNSNAYKAYKAYMDGLNEAVADFSTGMTLQNRTALGNFKKRYSSDIVPVENALKRRLELSEEQRKMAQQDRTLVFEKDAKNLDLDDIIANPAIGYGKSFSGKEVAAYAANMAKTLQKVYGDMYVEGDLTGNEYQTIKKIITTKGIDLDSLNTFLNDPNNKRHKYYEKLAPIMENIYEITGVRNWEGYNNEAYYLMLKPYLTQGMQDAIGDRSYSTVTLTNPEPTEGDGGKGGAEDRSSPYYNALDIMLSNNDYNDIKDRLTKAGLLKGNKLTKGAKEYLMEEPSQRSSTIDIGTSPSAFIPYVYRDEGIRALDDLLEFAQRYDNLVHWDHPKEESKSKQGKIAISDIEQLLNSSPDFQKIGTQYLVPQRTNISDKNKASIITNLEVTDKGSKVPTYEVDVASTKKAKAVTMKKATENINKSDINKNDIQAVFVTNNGVYVRLSNMSIVKISSNVNPFKYDNLTKIYNKWANSAGNKSLLLDYDSKIQQDLTNLLGPVDATTLTQSQNYE